MIKRVLLQLVLAIFLLSFEAATAQDMTVVLYPQSPLRVPIPSNATYTLDGRIKSFRQTYPEWGSSICRPPSGTSLPLIPVTVRSSGRAENWRIPSDCNPPVDSNGLPSSDASIDVVNIDTGFVYEVAATSWNSAHTAITATGAVAFLISGNGITPHSNEVTAASGISVVGYMATRYDIPFIRNGCFDHGLTMALPSSVLNGNTNGFVPPAVHAETQGNAGANGIPLGARFSIPQNVNLSLYTLHPLTLAILCSVQRYGIFVDDGNSAPNYGGGATGTIRFEVGVTDELYHVSAESLISTVQSQVYTVLQSVGLYRITGGSTSVTVTPTTGTPVSTVTATRTPRPTVVITSTFGCHTDITPDPLHIITDCH